MTYKTALSILFISILTLITPHAIHGLEPADRVADDQTGRQASIKDKDSVASELNALKEAVTRLEQKIEKLAARPSEFSQVEVQIVDERGETMSGFEVRLMSVGDVQNAEATGVSDGDGIGLSRNLPYGRYRMTVEGSGWRARDLVTVEVGKPLALTVIAPTPDQTAELVLQSSLTPELVSDLPFGEWQVKGGNSGWGTRIVPQPDEIQDDSDDWKTFPKVSDGIDVVAVVVDIAIERRIEQPAGGSMNWEWRPGPDDKRQSDPKWLVQSNGTLRPLLNVSEKSKQIAPQADRFQDLAPEEENDSPAPERSTYRKRLGYHLLELGPKHDDQAGIRLPAGQFELSVHTIYGRPTRDLSKAIDRQAESRGQQLWLRAVVSRQSKEWLTRLLGHSWDQTGRSLTKDVDVAVNGSEKITVGPGDSEKESR